MNPEENEDFDPQAEPEGRETSAHSELAELRELIGFLKDSGVVEFASERHGQKLSLKFAGAANAGPAAMDPGVIAAIMAHGASSPGHAPAQATPSPAAAPAAKPAASAAAESGSAPSASGAADEEAGWHIVKSPIVGTFFESPSPGSPAFVQTGDHVEQGQVLCIVEAMKLMNEIESDGAGELVKRFVNNGQPVEYGQRLFALKPRG